MPEIGLSFQAAQSPADTTRRRSCVVWTVPVWCGQACPAIWVHPNHTDDARAPTFHKHADFLLSSRTRSLEAGGTGTAGPGHAV